MAVRKTVSIVFNRENTATFEQFTCYVDKHRKYKEQTKILSRLRI